MMLHAPTPTIPPTPALPLKGGGRENNGECGVCGLTGELDDSAQLSFSDRQMRPLPSRVSLPPPLRGRAGVGGCGRMICSLLLTLCFATAAHAVEPDEILADSRLEARARQLSTGLRCLVCQNQSIDDSSAPLARDLRLLVRERLQTGETDAQVMRFITDRYGQFVLLNPPVGRNTLLLWATPVLLLAAAALVWWRRRVLPTAVPSAAPQAPLSPAEQHRLDTLLIQQQRDQSSFEP